MEPILEALTENAIAILGAVGTSIVGLVAVYARELALRSAARQAALKAEIAALSAPHKTSGSEKLSAALSAFKAEAKSPLLATSDRRRRQLVENEAQGAGEFVRGLARDQRPGSE